MRLYSGSSTQFARDTAQNQIAEKLRDSFFRQFHYHPSPAEVNAWRNSLKAMCLVVQDAGLNDHGVILEYQLPLSSKRLDCLFCGKDDEQKDNAVIVELKQWDRCQPAEGENEVVSWVGGSNRELLHPSVQVGQYRTYLEDTHTAFYEGQSPIALSACAYLHNYAPEPRDPLFAPKFKSVLQANPTFTLDQVDELSSYLTGHLKRGQGLETLRRIEGGSYRPSRKLMDHVAQMIAGQPTFTLLDEQLVVFDKVLALAKKGFHDRNKAVVIVRGGPGTGKSVIAINLMGALLGAGYNVHYATGSRAFTETLRKIIGTRGSAQFKYFNSYGQAELNAVDVLVCDEAHRIRRTSDSRWVRREARTDKPQVEELVDASKVCVFFIDDKQSVQPKEVGQVGLIRSHAENLKCSVAEYELEVQFRCRGSEAFVNWIDNTLGVRQTANVLWTAAEGFEFKVFDSPFALEKAISAKVAQGHTGRVTAGYCWKWSKEPKVDGTLRNDVVIGDYKRPWNARPESTNLAKGIPKATLWAYQPEGINQVGCVYTAQGFEFDYGGVIFGKDLRYDMDEQQWIGDRSESKDPVVSRSGDLFLDLVKKTYRVLLSRGMKGCYVHFLDKDTERFFRSRMEHVAVAELLTESLLTFFDADDPQVAREGYRTLAPVYTLAAAAGGLSGEQSTEIDRWLELKGARLTKAHFVARVQGRSMEPKIHDGDYCLFRLNPAGSREGKIVLVRLMETMDQETGGRFTIKEYHSEKAVDPDTGWRHAKVTLRPLNSEFQPIVLTAGKEGDVEVVAELVEVLGQP